MGGQVSRSDFEWVYTQQPHVARRKIILRKCACGLILYKMYKTGFSTYKLNHVLSFIEKYPEIKKLMGPDPHFKYIVSAMVIFQIISCYYISQLPWYWMLLFAYCLGGVINHSLTLAIHDISHNVTFGNFYPLANRLFGMWANLPIGVPMSISFKKYHVEHHRFLGVDNWDTDLPTKTEAMFFRNIPLKIVWLFLQPFFYAFRPFYVKPKPPSWLEILNTVIQIIFDLLVVYFCGIRGLLYFVGGTVISMGLHPMAAHFIAEHYMFDQGYETYSYYGVWNLLTFNVGYHMEHHDFPYIPGSRLPEVKRIAAEFYDPLPQHTSWLRVIWEFLMHNNKGPISRVKRDYSETFGTHKKDNPFLTIDTAHIYPTNKDLPMGLCKHGRGVDWMGMKCTNKVEENECESEEIVDI